jgi:hypothetical protein
MSNAGLVSMSGAFGYMGKLFSQDSIGSQIGLSFACDYGFFLNIACDVMLVISAAYHIQIAREIHLSGYVQIPGARGGNNHSPTRQMRVEFGIGE